MALLQGACAQAQNSEVATGEKLRQAQQLAEPEELLLVTQVNGKTFGEAILALKDPHGRVYVAAQDLRLWRLQLPSAAALSYHGADYFALDAYAGLKYNLDLARQTLSIMAAAQAFQSSTLAVPTLPEPTPTSPHLGGFFNYDLLANRALGSTQGAGEFELGIFSDSGVGTMGLVTPQQGGSSRLIRLDTTWSADQPQQRQSWRLGDVINRAGAWGRSVRMGGIQFGSNFATQPGFITFPVQQAAGLATLPSTVDVFVNNTLAAQRDVPPGPFSITHLPVVTGSGEVRLVVRDMLGREQVVTQPFYASSGLLAEGLHDYSYELGVTRQNFGIDSNDYANGAAVATHRLGFDDRFTGELHLELQSHLRAVGVSGLYLLPQLGILNATLAASQANNTRSSNDMGGTLAAIGFERQSQAISFSLHSQWASPGFRQLGLDSQQFAPARQVSVAAGYATQKMGSFGISYLRQDVRAQPGVGITTLSYSVDSRRYGSLMVSAMGSSGGGGRNQQLSLVWSMPLGNNRSFSLMQTRAHSDAQGSTHGLVAMLQQNVPAGAGYGYLLQAHDSGDALGNFTYQNNVGTYDVELARSGAEDAMRVGARGGIALLGGQPYFNRWISDSFGVARVAGFPNVRVYADNQLVGTTDANGDAMLPQLHPYENNQISIDARDLPLNAQVDALRVQAVPYFRSGVLAEFPVRPSYGALFRVVLDHDQPLPAGATVELLNGKTQFPVAYKGEVYVTGLAARNRMVARWKQQSCEFEVRFIPVDDPVPDLGKFSCKGITP